MFKTIKQDEEVLELIKRGDMNLDKLGYTEHSVMHCSVVAKEAERILKILGYDKKQVELAKIAGFMHDIGNTVNRDRHAEYGAILANQILQRMDMSVRDRLTIVSAIGNHDESTGVANDVVSAALIIADKTDVRRNRVRSKAKANFDIHDRVNYVVRKSQLKVDKENMVISLNLDLDEDICTMYEYFDIFLGRMMMCRKAAEILGCKFKLLSNGHKIL
ncbi:MAG: HD domain-containing protein [Lachnospiraceae bacterium]|nr:HD domain-containing protein [Lachnospiraceae bacterium]